MPFKIVRNDITKMQVDAIVNTANPNPGYGAGIDTAVYEAGTALNFEVLEAAVSRVRKCKAADMPMAFAGGAWKKDIDRDFEKRSKTKGRKAN